MVVLRCFKTEHEDHFKSELARLNPAELLIPDDPALTNAVSGLKGLKPRPVWEFDQQESVRLLKLQFGVQDLAAFDCEDQPVAIRAAGCVLGYVQATQSRALPHLQQLRRIRNEDSIIIDPTSRRNLELVVNLQGGRDHTLLAVLDQTKTPMGARLLARWLTQPLRDSIQIEARLEAVSAMQQQSAFQGLRDVLAGAGDVERIVARIALQSARPRDLARLRDTLNLLPEISEILKPIDAPMVVDLATSVQAQPILADLLTPRDRTRAACGATRGRRHRRRL